MRSSRSQTIAWTAGLTLAFAFRLAYGLSSNFWTEDERQVYLIGLRSYARGEWPYFGADVVWTGSQLPGALQALLIRWPLEVWPVPEAPFLLLNLLSFGTLALLAWYLGRRLPDVPAWLVWGALLTLPWTLNFSTHIVNTSYILPGATLFFVGFFEGAPAIRAAILPLPLAWALMGAGLLFLVQIHMSWVLLPPYVAFAAIDLIRRNGRAALSSLSALVAGGCVTGSLLVPTLLEFGPVAGGVERTVEFHLQGPQLLLTIAARFLSFASFETNRFLGLTTAERLLFLWRQPWVAPFALLVTLIGILQPLVMAIAWFKRAHDTRDWHRVKQLAAATVVLIYVSFFFSVRGPLAHAFYVVFPVAALYACYCWRMFAGTSGLRDRKTRTWERVAAGALAAGVLMHTGLALDRVPRKSLYVDRGLVQAAITARNDRFLGDRRDSLQQAQDRRPRGADRVRDVEAYLGADPVADLDVVQAAWSPVAGGRISRFIVSLRNRSDVAGYLDLRYAIRYSGAMGEVLAEREGVIKEILQPGEMRTWDDVTDGMTPEGAARAAFTIVTAEKCIPAAAISERDRDSTG